jgi:alpha-N-arabinofuranosidase
MNAQGIAFVHNLIAGPIQNYRSDTRVTPYQAAHSTEFAGLYPAGRGDSGDHRFYNNLIVAPCNLRAIDNSMLPCFAAGNVFTGGAQPSKFDTGAVVEPKYDAGLNLTKEADGWYLTLSEESAWREAAKRTLITSDRLGTASVSNASYENAAGTALLIAKDYFGNRRNLANPFPGPFEASAVGKRTLKVWPIAQSDEH